MDRAEIVTDYSGATPITTIRTEGSTVHIDGNGKAQVLSDQLFVDTFWDERGMSELNAGKEDSTKTLRGHEDITADDKGNDATTTASAEKDETGRSDDASDPDFCAKKKKRRKLMTQKEREAADEATRARKREWAHKNKVSNKTQRERDQVEIASLRSALSHAEFLNSTLTQQIRLR